MNKKILSTIFFVLTTLVSISAQAQDYPDYVITVKGDSIPCRITDPLIGRGRYKDSTMPAAVRITADRIKEYYISDGKQLYRTVYINDDKIPEFLRVLENGTISLYQEIDKYYSSLYGPGPSTIENWLVGKNTDHVIYFKKSSFNFKGAGRGKRKAEFAALLADNKKVYDKFLADDDFSFNEIQNIVHLYNTGEPYDGTYNGIGHIFGRNYIITPKNDTVFCGIKNDYFSGNYIFKRSYADRYVTIDSTNAKEFFLARDTSHFVLTNEPGNSGKIFLKRLEKGRINLYQKIVMTNKPPVDGLQSFLYISKGDAPLTPIMSGMYFPRHFDVRKYVQLKVFFNAIADNPGLSVACENAFNVPEADKAEVMRSYIKSYNMVSLSNNETGKQ